MLPIMAAGLSSIIFSISTDASYLNTPSRSVEVPVTSIPAASVPAASVPAVSVPVSSVPSVEVPPIQQPVSRQRRDSPSAHRDASFPSLYAVDNQTHQSFPPNLHVNGKCPP